MTRIAISHIGLCTPLGQSPATVLARLNLGDTSAMHLRDDLLLDACTLVGEVSEPLAPLPTPLSHFESRNNRLLFCAAKQITAAVAQACGQYGSQRVGIVIGTSTSGIASGEQALTHKAEQGELPEHYYYSQQELGNSSDFLRALFSTSGPCYTVSTACSSSAKVFSSARRLLQANLCDMVIVGGSDSLCKLTLNGFSSLESVSKGHNQPFSANRDGINIGEGAALFTLALGDAEIMLAGIGESSDAHHISAPHPEGRGAISAIKAALDDAGITPQDIDYINLHGTATRKNDAMESRALQQVFGESIPPCSSTKPLIGHTLGAAGAIEAAFCYLLLSSFNKEQALPPQIWDQQQDPDDPSLPLVSKGQTADIQYVMSNSFAFGGSNASLIFCRGKMPL
ncbi:beta-ketoacyl-[acyl-carrier-protein] synthase family protein [Shewanella sp. D64]|uniref:beta-ketoacyl-[acyl-carrier-protein] synthase family protein n=1 Tax=unclassified Shewanella TaxID=196818 RepID=UPI0022BA3B38|nr:MULTISPECIES: beta-ketoacyl-[acyl-carrier-protein] synthase family protein [unclassified Shewanella]MEC4726861.1 beta-ketoacyl-[acyl-carrier-protein] synthase family protein [Shewanella sp. D64]MEC4739027.1 beta-ketoacyl-[acyl-carrier-protein] synthase family protein [Shewanella sp. E94]WBJ95887.1 beta-ketoacyl-[acyl-carrier-protein] synthase family protein [Shewanella sp. MTB7]